MLSVIVRCPCLESGVAVSRQVDVQYLEEHFGMLVRVSIDVQRAVQSSPLQPYREPMALVAALVEVGLRTVLRKACLIPHI